MMEAPVKLPPIVVSKSIQQKTLEALERIENRLGDLLSAYLAVNGEGTTKKRRVK